jgi:hypothetical protein
MARTRILKEELDYVVATRNLELARKAFRRLKNSGTATEEELERAQASLDKQKEKFRLANEAINRSGLSKGSI